MTRYPELESKYAALNDLGRAKLLEMADQFLLKWRAEVGRSTLTLVHGGRESKILERKFDGGVNDFPVIRVRQPIDR